jgi:hypothetical protein
MSLLDQYTKATALTRCMRDAARQQDWDQLAIVGEERDGILATLPEALPPMSVAESSQLRPLIEEILACHTEINEHAGPWLDHTRTLLAAFEHAG